MSARNLRKLFTLFLLIIVGISACGPSNSQATLTVVAIENVNAAIDKLLNQAKIHVANGENTLALGAFQNALNLDNQNGVIFLSRGQVYETMQIYEKAISDYENAISLGLPENLLGGAQTSLANLQSNINATTVAELDTDGQTFLTCINLEPLGSNTLNFPTYHVQGLAVTEDFYYISSVDRDNARGRLFKVDRNTLFLLVEKELTDGALIHPGGIEMDDTYLWIPNAEYDRDGPSEILALDLQSLEVSRSFSVDDHISLIASNGRDRLYGTNWDSVNFYVWDWDGNLIEVVANPTDMAYQDCEFSDPYLVCGGTKDSGGFGAIDYIDPENWTLAYRIEVGSTSLGHPLTREGLSLLGDEVFLLPEDGPDSEIMFYQACQTATLSAAPVGTIAGPVPLLRTHAHNDYQHARPLYDALGQGFVSVEVDIHLVGAELLVAHDADQLQPSRTLRSLYLDPLRERIRNTGGSVYPSGVQFTLLIDIKSEAVATYEILRDILKDYRDILTTFESNEITNGPVLVIISGNRPRDLMESEAFRYAAYDGRLDDLGSGAPATFIPLISDKWTTHFTWNGVGPMPEEERQKLKAIVDEAHLNGQRVRFWDTPDDPSPAREAVWLELIAAGVDMINTDDLRGLRQYLLENDPLLLEG